MNEEKIKRLIPGENVVKDYCPNFVYLSVLRLFFVALGVYALYSALQTVNIADKIIQYLLLLLALWRIYRLSYPVLYLCERGLVVKRSPNNLQEAISSFLEADKYYVYIDYRVIMGFVQNWRFIQVVSSGDGHGALIGVDLQYLDLKAKKEICELIIKYQEENNDLK